ncbi:cysteine synthase family protein [Phytomonospora endophytica]|uniref:Cysteine synthase A n=1 Tax=Phytomonospora endophytica TaxID=714109 RepID=A0A841FUJ7_9ACTN|nr:cysteine synthase family protein [Phytomonospora endophytica]MBB6040035.1 cysteine synthase A [Phytomonospora endophytica]GIG71592.1 cystathionine beta-synthase [Phytomonospora endophytica]
MHATHAYADTTEAYQLPRLIKLGPNLYGIAFTLMKMIPARYILNKAQRDGLLGPGTVIAETTSGTFGLALAMQGVHLDRRVILVSDPVIDARLYQRLTDLGASVERVPESSARKAGGYQVARLNRLAEIKNEHESVFCPEQYSNPDNPRSYSRVSELLVETFGQVDCIVGPVGSGGSMSGTVSYLRTVQPECRAIAVDTHASVLFGQPDGPRELRGLGMSVMPTNLDHTVFDSVHWCQATAAYTATRQLHQRHALFMGPTSGSAYMVARWWAQANPDALTVAMLPDEGYRYQHTVYDDEWLSAQGHHEGRLPTEPVLVDRPDQTAGPWTTYEWARRSYTDVMAFDALVDTW